MPKPTDDRLQGTLDLLVLKTLAVRGSMNGYAITLHIERISEDILRLEEGSLYPALPRMTQAGWLKSEWGISENNRRARYYSITLRGANSCPTRSRTGRRSRERWARVLQFT